MDQNKVKYLIDVLMGISFVVTTITGLLIFFFLPSGVPKGGYQTFLGIIKNTWSDWHTYAGILMILLVGIHLLLNIKWIIHMTKSMFKKKDSKQHP